MSSLALATITTVLAATLLGFGIGYAYLIYERPFPPNKTSHSVVIGVAFTSIPVALIQLVILIYLGEDRLWWLLALPFVGFLITGIPQIYVEWLKDREQKQDNERFTREFNQSTTTGRTGGL